MEEISILEKPKLINFINMKHLISILWLQWMIKQR